VRHGDYIAKLRGATAADSEGKATHRKLDLKAGPDVYGPALIDDLRINAFDVDLQVQLCADLNAMPVNDSTAERPEAQSPFVTVRRLHLSRQDVSGAETFARCDALAFTQWCVHPEDRPLGGIMDVRVYSTSARVRREINSQPQG